MLGFQAHGPYLGVWPRGPGWALVRDLSCNGQHALRWRWCALGRTYLTDEGLSQLADTAWTG